MRCLRYVCMVLIRCFVCLLFATPLSACGLPSPSTFSIAAMHASDMSGGPLAAGSSSSNPVSLTVGVLALQGGFHEHADLLRLAAKNLEAYIKLDVTFVRLPKDLEPCDALVLPGGESTTITLLAKNNGLMEPLREFVKTKPVWGTCAGMICLSKSIYTGQEQTKAQQQQEGIGGVDVCVVRNQYGRQVSCI